MFAPFTSTVNRSGSTAMALSNHSGAGGLSPLNGASGAAASGEAEVSMPSVYGRARNLPIPGRDGLAQALQMTCNSVRL